MWEFITLAISSILAIIGASLNTEKDEKGKKRTIFKKPNQAGWIVIILLICFSLVQLNIQIDKNADDQINSAIQKNRRTTDSLNIKTLIQNGKDDSLSFLKQFELNNNTYNKQIEALTTSNTILLRTNAVNENVTRNFNSSFKKFEKILHQSNSLLNPLLPMVVRFQLKIPFSNNWMKDYVERITKYKDSITKSIQLFDLGGLNHISMDGSSFEVTDSLSKFNIDSNRDGVTHRFLNPGYYIYFFNEKPPRYYHNTKNELFLEATKKISQPWPTSPFGNGLMFLDFKNKFLYLSVFYKIDNYPNKATLKGLNDIPNKYLLLTSQMPNKEYEILNIAFFTGTDFSNYTLIKLNPKECISDEKFPAGGISDTKDYLHKITSKDLQ